MRAHVIAAMQAERAGDVFARCTGDRSPGATSHAVYERELARSRFCLVIPGDLLSSGRLGEAVTAGCIPVLVGPPWHSLPLLPLVPYNRFALFFTLTDTPWVTTADDAAALRARAGTLVLEPRQVAATVVRDMAAVVAALRALPAWRERELRDEVFRVQSLFDADEASPAGRGMGHAALEAACAAWYDHDAA